MASSFSSSSRVLGLSVLLGLAGCAVGPDFKAPTAAAPDDWAGWHSGDPALRAPLQRDAALPAQWWSVFHDPVLDGLQARVEVASPDLQTAVLHFAQARVSRQGQEAQRGPTLDATGGISRQRQSENGASTRMLDAISSVQGGSSATGSSTSSDQLVKLLSEPFTLYQAGFDASWELDLWGRVRRSLEAADADVARQAALLDLARLSLRCEVARNYFELRGVQRRLALSQHDLQALEEQQSIVEARVKRGAVNHLDLLRQQGDVLAARAQLSALQAQEGSLKNQISLLLGERPGALNAELAPNTTSATADATPLPQLALGLPAEVAQRRPDIRAAEARLRSATASIGVAQAQLYPSIRLGAHFGLESFMAGEFSDWGSRAWSIGPSLSLPIFDGARRKSQVELRTLEQQEAAVAYHRTVLQAWHEIDDALTGYAAELKQQETLQARVLATRESQELAQARYKGGETDIGPVLDTQRAQVRARSDLAASRTRMETRLVAINKAVGNAAVTDEP